MTLKEGHKLWHWNYFLVLESDLEHLSRFVEFTEDNYDTYSQEMAHIILAACSEIDDILKRLCRKNDSSFKGRSIEKYRELLNPKYPKLNQFNVTLIRFGLNIKPWENWQSDRTPNWWSAHQDVKHNREEFYKKANLRNTITSLAGLFLAVLYYYQSEADIGDLFPDPKIIMLQDDSISLSEVSQRGLRIRYDL